MVNPVTDWFDSIYLRYRGNLLRIAKGLLHPPELAEDIIQKTFLTMLTKYDDLKNYENIYGWLIRTLKNQIMTEMQKAYYSQEIAFLPQFDPPAPDIFNENFIAELPDGLSQSEKEILYLYIEAGYSHKEIAEQIGCSVDACRMRYFRAKRHCQELLKEKFTKDPLYSTGFDKLKEQEV